jgi:hypothetical protein
VVLVSAMLAVVVGLAVFLAGFGVGRATKRADNIPICSCAHGYGNHDAKGRCHAQIKRSANRYTQWVDCPCVRYDGPEVMSGVWVPPVTGGS